MTFLDTLIPTVAYISWVDVFRVVVQQLIIANILQLQQLMLLEVFFLSGGLFSGIFL